MKPSEEFFKMPIRIYDPNYSKDKAETYLDNTGLLMQCDYIVGAVRIKIQDIYLWEAYFDENLTLDEVRKKGFDCTSVMVGGLDYICDWNMDTFEKEYNKFNNKLHKALIKQFESEDMIITGDLTEEQKEEFKSIIKKK